MTEKEVWLFIADQWEKEPSNDIMFPGFPEMTNDLFTSKGLCLSLDYMDSHYKFNYTDAVDRVSRYRDSHGLDAYFFPEGSSRKERASLARLFASQCP